MNKNKNSEQEINDFLSKVEIPLGNSKEDIWAEKFEKVILSKESQQSKKTNTTPKVITLFQYKWTYAIAASVMVLLTVTLYNSVVKSDNSIEDQNITFSEKIVASNDITFESLFVEDNEFDDWFEEEYVLQIIN
jgi:hypothetical protein